ncbi:response regulator [Sediminicola sp. 1XM1-17]|uniref:response regulator n=1 Tax=Sediminicola sp. 1XM1-17 TaxID=3127702 RepID=UPI00307850D0
MKHYHIMLIDDNEGDLFLMNEVLERIVVAESTIIKDGQEALDFFNDNSCIPELVFLDINLPKKNGYEVLEFIRNELMLKNIPVIVFSTSSSIEDVMKSYKGDASVFLTKPVNFDDFEQLVTKAVQFWINYSKLLQENFIGEHQR